MSRREREEFEQSKLDLVEEAKLQATCPECGEIRLGDERVEAGMPCIWCSTPERTPVSQKEERR